MSVQMTDWFALISRYSSMHGFAWYNRVSNKCLRGLICLSAFAVIISLPVVLITQITLFMNTDRTTNFVEWHTAKNMTYPYITVCHPKYFDTRLLQSN